MANSSVISDNRPYENDYIFKIPFMKYREYEDGEFEKDEKLFLTALTGRFKLKKDGFHRLIAKFILHLNVNLEDSSKRLEFTIPSFASKFTSTIEISNRINLNDVFDCELKDEQLKCCPFESFSEYKDDFLNKAPLYASISSLLIRLKTNNPKNLKAKYKKFSFLFPYYGRRCEESVAKLPINFNRFNKIMKEESDEINFAICYMVLIYENYPESKANMVFRNSFLESAKYYGLALYIKWAKLAEDEKKLELLNKSVNFISANEFEENLYRFSKEIRISIPIRVCFSRLIDLNFFNYMGISTNLKAILVILYIENLFCCSGNDHIHEYFKFVESRKRRANFQELTDEEKEYMNKEYQKYPKIRPGFF